MSDTTVPHPVYIPDELLEKFNIQLSPVPMTVRIKEDEVEDVFYLKYAVDRLCHFKNVWWSLANEYDLLPWKSVEDWELYARGAWAGMSTDICGRSITV